MVYLSRIYTKTGDRGDTGLGDGTRVPKDHPRVTACGTVDELNAVLGVFIIHLGEDKSAAAMIELIRCVQNDLFDVGADLCLPLGEAEEPGKVLRVRADQAERLEKAIDGLNERLQPLKSFILPGGAQSAAWCHLARTVCRRAERDVVTLAGREKINSQVIVYLNRLSDLLFVVGRVCNRDGHDDVLWIPGGAPSEPEA
jgi:cob(I)alamin adenosyltransferase